MQIVSTFAPPAPYAVGYSFSNYQALNPAKPIPAPRVDIELAAIETAIGALVGALALVQRSDGALANGIVTYDSLSPDLILALGVAAPVAPLQVAQMKVVLAYINAAGIVEQAVPADPNSIAAIQWTTGGTLAVGDPLWQVIQTTLGYDDTMMAVLGARALTLGALVTPATVYISQVKKALAASGQVGTVERQIPADPNSIVKIRWTTGGKTTPTDELGVFLSGLGFNAATLYAAAAGL